MNEFITTLMLNFLANFLVEYLIATPFKDPGTQWPATYVIARDGILPVWGKIDSAALIMLVVYAAMVYFFKKSRLGYELRVMGQNSLFAKVGGCETGKNFFVAMLLSGALATTFPACLSTQFSSPFCSPVPPVCSWTPVSPRSLPPC